MGRWLRGADVAEAILACVIETLDTAAAAENAELEETGCEPAFDGAPDRALTAPAATSYEACDCGGEIVVYPERRWATNGLQNFPGEGQRPTCGVAIIAEQYAIRVLRCACTSPADDGVAPPTVECQTAKGRQVHLDMAAVVAALNCCDWGIEDDEWALVGQDPIQPAGGCVGSLTHVVVAIRPCCPAPDA